MVIDWIWIGFGLDMEWNGMEWIGLDWIGYGYGYGYG